MSPSRSTSVEVVRPRRRNIAQSNEYVDVKRQPRTSINNTSERALNDYWNDKREREVLLSEGLDWHNSFPHVDDEASRRIQVVNGRPTNVQKTTRLDTI